MKRKHRVEVVKCKDCAKRGTIKCPCYFYEDGFDLSEDEGYCFRGELK